MAQCLRFAVANEITVNRQVARHIASRSCRLAVMERQSLSSLHER